MRENEPGEEENVMPARQTGTRKKLKRYMNS
jgi:hypothetical protein